MPLQYYTFIIRTIPFYFFTFLLFYLFSLFYLFTLCKANSFILCLFDIFMPICFAH